MNKRQARTVERLHREILKTFTFGGNSEYEYKEWEVYESKITENKDFVSVVAEVGMVGDEGTMAEIFCRYRVHIFVGQRGGLTYPASNKRTGRYIEKPVKTIFGVYMDQK